MEPDVAADGTRSRVAPLFLALSGVLLLAWSLVEPAWLLATGSPDVYQLRYVIGYVTIVPSCLGLVAGGRWLAASNIPAKYDRTIGGFTLAGGVGFLVFNLFLAFFFPSDSVWIVANWVRWALSLGLGVGFVIGFLYTRGLVENLSAERHSLRAAHAEKQRELIDQLNGILRHEVLNSAQLIQGNAQLLIESDEPIDPDNERLERLFREGEDLADVIQEVRALLTTIEGEERLQAVRLDDVLEEEVERLRSTYPDAAVDLAVPDDVVVAADALLGRVFSNLLRNAVVHNPSGSLTVTVDVEIGADATVVTVSDDGDGIPDHQIETLFDRPQVGTHGLGLYLVHALVERYDGTIDLVETGSHGTTFTITFPPLPQNAGQSPDEPSVIAGPRG